MRRDLTSSVIAIVVITVLCGLAYPLVVTGISQVAFPGNSNGQKIEVDGRLVGSKIIAQDFRGNPRYFQSRPSTQTKYNAAASGFTNLGPNSKDARDTFKASLARYLKLEQPYTPGLTAKQVPVDAVTSSASGVDPEISKANAEIQAHRVARVRGVPLATVQKLIDQSTDGRSFGFLGESGVNVLELNLALDRQAK
jgi:K+-transporting ATPase ATPase C chain